MNASDSIPYTSLPAEQIGRQPPGYRAPAGLRIGAVTLQIADLGRSLAFYEGALGFAVLGREERDGQRVVHLGPHGEGQPVLLTLVEKPGVRPQPRRGLLGLYHFAVLLPSRGDLGRFIANLVQRGVPFGSADHLYSEATYLTDPDGITVEVYRDLPRTDWQVHPDGQLIGGSVALDAPALLAAGAGRPYAGLPAGTVIGHMHLYGDDLAEAARFYHQGMGLAKMTWGFPGALFMAAGGYHHHVGVNTWAAGSPQAGENDARLLSWQLLLPTEADVAAMTASLHQAGYAEPVDAWGNRVEVMKNIE